MIPGIIKRALTSQYLSMVLRLILGAFFIYASLGKIAHPGQFAQSIADYRIVPYIVINLGAVLLPWIEFLTGLFLIMRFKSRASVVVIALLLVMFEVMILINMYRGAPISCGCFAAGGEPIGWEKVFEDGVMLVFAIHIYNYDRLEVMKKFRTLTSPGRTGEAR
ncbi:MAG: MauE/DoxX family redox-associated membrane protein [Syntrophobacteraceae bacterium]